MNLPQVIEQATLLANEMIAPEIHRMELHAPGISGVAQPGQFVMLGLSGLDPLLRRPFSIHQCTDNSITLLYKVVGKGTTAMAQMGAPQQVSLLGPLGNGFQPALEATHHCLVGGGLGIAPMLFLANHIRKSQPNAGVTILLGGRNKQELLAQEEFAPLGNLQVATDDGSAGLHGFVSELLENIDRKDMHVYTCGPLPMMKVVAEICRKKSWLCQVSLESHMACGMGACLGCAVEKAELRPNEKKYVHVCKDGPVFNASLLWL